MQDVEWLDPLVERERSRELEAYARQKLGIASLANMVCRLAILLDEA